MTDKEKIRKEIVRMHNLLPVMDDYNIYVNYADRICTTLEMYIDSLQEEPVSEDLEEAANDYAHDLLHDDVFETFIAGAKWKEANLWKDAQGDDLPDIDREVVVLYQPYPCEGNEYAVGFGHRPKEYYDSRNIETNEVTRYYPKRFDKGGWNIPDVKWWLGCDLPKRRNKL